MSAEFIPARFISREEFGRILDYEDEMLKIWAKRIADGIWNTDFNISINFTEEVHRTYGCFIVNTVTKEQFIVISKRMVKHNYYNPQMVEKIIMHEMCQSMT